jgi:uncharacterized protein YkwD
MYRRVLRTVCTGVVGTALVVSLLVGVAPPSISTPHSGQTYQVSQYDKALVRLINRARKARGLRPFKLSVRLAQSSDVWSRRLASRTALSHDPNLQRAVVQARCSAVSYIGENVAFDSSSPRSMFQRYMRSPVHRANLLSRRYTQIGTATVVTRSRRGTASHWNTMRFARARCK